jgi:hypothetical protein
MIPPLVALIASAHETRNYRGIEELLLRLRIGDRLGEAPPKQVEDLLRGLSAAETLPTLPTARLVPDRPAPGPIGEVLAALRPDQLMVGLRSEAEGLSLQAGLYLVHGFLDEAHELVQQADQLGRTTTAPYWHAIMHRREPDYDNARYWFRRVGRHSAFDALAAEVAQRMTDDAFVSRLRFDRVLDPRGRWDSMAFVDLCEQCGRTWDSRAQAAAELQAIEFRVLLEFTCRAATGGA